MTSPTAITQEQPPALQAALDCFPLQQISTALGLVEYRQSGDAAAVTHVLLHGIGSGSGSWLMQLQAASNNPHLNLLAWNAPGYGASDPLPAPAPTAADYAARLWAWLGAVNDLGGSHHEVAAPFTLVGHSLGCLMAASAALPSHRQADRIKRLVLLSPAQGYRSAPAAVRDKKLNDRLHNLAQLGPLGVAQKRSAAMLSPQANAAHISFVQSIMSQINPAGYSQAAHMLAGGDLLADLTLLATQKNLNVQVASGSADTITPPAGCQSVAQQLGAPYDAIPGAGHVCALEAFAHVNQLLGLGLAMASPVTMGSEMASA